jgi:hypothetical protein
MKGTCLKAISFLSIILTTAAGLFVSGCGIEEPAERVWFEPKPYTNQLPEAYGKIQLNESTSADVLEIIKQYPQELVSQSESVVACWAEKKKTYQFWLTMVAFEEEGFTATRKYFLAVDEKPWHIHAEGQKMRFDTEEVFDEETLSEAYTSENQKRIAILTKVLENIRDDIMQVRQDSRVLNTGGMMINQTFEGILYVLKQSPDLAERLNQPKGLEFDHLTMGKGWVKMVLEDKIVKLKIRIGRSKKGWEEK